MTAPPALSPLRPQKGCRRRRFRGKWRALNYPQAIRFLYDLRVFGLKFGLDTTRQLAARAGDPQARLRFVHVAGTNGKGSTCAFLESIYRAAGLRTGLFTSPHLVSFRERIQVNREWISEADAARLTADVAALIDRGQPPTFFEMATVMALKYFAERQCDIVIWETGLGGRLDATNIVTPLVSVITNVALDHQQYLGDTIEQIAAEKAGIIKDGVPVVTAAEEPALAVIQRIAEKHNSMLMVVSESEARRAAGMDLSLAGKHQHLNAALTLWTLKCAAVRSGVTTGLGHARSLLEGELTGDMVIDAAFNRAAIKHGLSTAAWPGRLQLVSRPDGRRFLLDGAHNPAGAQSLADALQSGIFGAEKPAIILGAMADKDWAGMCGILAPLASRIFITPVGSARSADPAGLVAACENANPAAPRAVCAGIADALEKSAGGKFIVVTGSLHFVGEALEALGLAEAPSERELNEYTQPARRKSRIQAVTFDVGGTLMEPWPSVGHVYAEVAKAHGVHVDPEVLNRQFAAAWKRKGKFGHNMLDWSNMVDATFAGLTAEPPSKTFFPELYDVFASPRAWRLYDDSRPTLAALRQRGFKIGAISNWDERLRPLLREMEMDACFDTIVISGEERRVKPDQAIFQTAAERLGVAPSEILHIGDSQVEDYEGARAAGFEALWLRRGAAAGAAGEIGGLAEALGKI